MLFRVSQSFPKVGEGEFLGKKTKTQYLNIKQVYKFSAESTKELKRVYFARDENENAYGAESTKELKLRKLWRVGLGPGPTG